MLLPKTENLEHYYNACKDVRSESADETSGTSAV